MYTTNIAHNLSSEAICSCSNAGRKSPNCIAYVVYGRKNGRKLLAYSPHELL